MTKHQIFSKMFSQGLQSTALPVSYDINMKKVDYEDVFGVLVAVNLF